MPVDSDSAIAWHRAQLTKLRGILKNVETSRFTVGEQSTGAGKTQKTIAELQQKTRVSQHITAAPERQPRRPPTPDRQTRAGVSWSSWTTRPPQARSGHSS